MLSHSQGACKHPCKGPDTPRKGCSGRPPLLGSSLADLLPPDPEHTPPAFWRAQAAECGAQHALTDVSPVPRHLFSRQHQGRSGASVALVSRALTALSILGAGDAEVVQGDKVSVAVALAFVCEPLQKGSTPVVRGDPLSLQPQLIGNLPLQRITEGQAMILVLTEALPTPARQRAFASATAALWQRTSTAALRVCSMSERAGLPC